MKERQDKISSQAALAARCMVVLERIGTPEAQDVLKELAGSKTPECAAAAKAALDRLNRKVSG
jgi:hypothetical protein